MVKEACSAIDDCVEGVLERQFKRRVAKVMRSDRIDARRARGRVVWAAKKN